MTHLPTTAERIANILDSTKSPTSEDKIHALEAALRVIKSDLRRQVSYSSIALDKRGQDGFFTDKYLQILESPIPDSKKLGELLRLARVLRGRYLPEGEIKVKDVAAATGIASSTIHSWERGDTSPRYSSICQLSAFLNLPSRFFDVSAPAERLAFKPAQPVAQFESSKPAQNPPVAA